MCDCVRDQDGFYYLTNLLKYFKIYLELKLNSYKLIVTVLKQLVDKNYYNLIKLIYFTVYI